MTAQNFENRLNELIGAHQEETQAQVKQAVCEFADFVFSEEAKQLLLRAWDKRRDEIDDATRIRAHRAAVDQPVIQGTVQPVVQRGTETSTSFTDLPSDVNAFTSSELPRTDLPDDFPRGYPFTE